MKLECTIFDFDGTLFDSMWIWNDVAKNYLQTLNIEAKPSLLDEVKTMSLAQGASYIQKEYHLSLSIENIINGINQTITHYYLYEILPKPGVIHFIKQLKKMGIHLCIATASDRQLVEAALKRTDMIHDFEAILTCGEVGHGKDEPIIFQQAMNHFHASYKTTMIFEDALHAIETAKKDGFMVTGIYDDSENQQDEVKKISDCYIKDFLCTEDFFNFIK